MPYARLRGCARTLARERMSAPELLGSISLLPGFTGGALRCLPFAFRRPPQLRDVRPQRSHLFHRRSRLDELRDEDLKVLVLARDLADGRAEQSRADGAGEGGRVGI